MLYTQTSLSLVYNLERVSKSLHCYFATYQFGIVAWLRLEPKNYSTKPYSLHRRCSFGPVAVALGQLSESFVLSAAFLLLGVVCVALDLLLGVGGRQMSLSLRAGRAALAEDMGMTLLAQHTTFNTLDNWAIKTPPNEKGKGPERKGYRVMARNMYTIHSITYHDSVSVCVHLTQCSLSQNGKLFLRRCSEPTLRTLQDIVACLRWETHQVQQSRGG